MSRSLVQVKEFEETIKTRVTTETVRDVERLTQRLQSAAPHSRITPSAVRRMLLAMALQHCAVLTTGELLELVQEHLGRFA